jgi:hypothetical protein
MLAMRWHTGEADPLNAETAPFSELAEAIARGEDPPDGLPRAEINCAIKALRRAAEACNTSGPRV